MKNFENHCSSTTVNNSTALVCLLELCPKLSSEIFAICVFLTIRAPIPGFFYPHLLFFSPSGWLGLIMKNPVNSGFFENKILAVG